MKSQSESPGHDAPIRVGTRASLLARTQTGWVVEQLRSHGHAVEIVTISTQGDRRDDVPISAIGGDGVFVRELERALLERRIDAAVHSLKDLPTEETPGLTVAYPAACSLQHGQKITDLPKALLKRAGFAVK
jgi:porphobilinogen deaminase